MAFHQISSRLSLLYGLSILALACDRGDDGVEGSGTGGEQGALEHHGSSSETGSGSGGTTSANGELDGTSTTWHTSTSGTSSSSTTTESNGVSGDSDTNDHPSDEDAADTSDEDSETTQGDDLVPGDQNCVQSELPRVLTPNPSESARHSYRDAISDLGFKLLANAADTDDNLAFSALSISTAIGLPLSAAAGETLTKLSGQLGLPEDRNDAAEVLNYVELELESRTGPVGNTGDKQVILEVANALYVLPGQTPQSDYLDFLAQHWGMGVCGEAFYAHAGESRDAINHWVSERTRGKIPTLFGPGSIGSLTTQVFVNAVYFEAPWYRSFRDSFTKPGPFHLLDGASIEVPIMNQDFWGEARLAAYEGTTIIELPLADKNELSAIFVVPELGQYKHVESTLNTEILAAMTALLEPLPMRLYLPKFVVDSGTLELYEDLEKLGLDEVARGEDFSYYGGQHGTALKPVDHFLHRTFIGIDEKGVVAAAASGGATKDSTPPDVRVDRPFLFLIRDRPTGINLFFGRVLNPVR